MLRNRTRVNSPASGARARFGANGGSTMSLTKFVKILGTSAFITILEALFVWIGEKLGWFMLQITAYSEIFNLGEMALVLFIIVFLSVIVWNVLKLLFGYRD